jgi:hypothetical protein
MDAIYVTGGALAGLIGALALWLAWGGRRDVRAYRRWCGGTWGCVATLVGFGTSRSEEWMPEAEIREGQHVVAWEQWPGRTRVRKRGGR